MAMELLSALRSGRRGTCKGRRLTLPTLCVRDQIVIPRSFHGRKGWGTHSVVAEITTKKAWTPGGPKPMRNSESTPTLSRTGRMAVHRQDTVSFRRSVLAPQPARRCSQTSLGFGLLGRKSSGARRKIPVLRLRRSSSSFTFPSAATQQSIKKGPDRAFFTLADFGCGTIGRGKAAGRHCSLH